MVIKVMHPKDQHLERTLPSKSNIVSRIAPDHVLHQSLLTDKKFQIKRSITMLCVNLSKMFLSKEIIL